MPTANPAHIAALLTWARAHKMPRLASYCLAAQQGDEAAEAAVAESIEDMLEDEETAAIFH